MPAELLDSTTRAQLLDTPANSEEYTPTVLICSYEFAARNEIRLRRHWDLIVADEAHRLRTVDTEKLRETEAAKIAAARKHFAVLDIDYDVASPEHWNIAQP